MTCLQSGKWSQSIKCIPGCKLPDDIPPLNQQQKPFHVIEEHIPSSTFLCSLPSVLSSENGMICTENGLWNEIVKCISRCGPPVNVPPMRTQKQYYKTGETIVSSEFLCDLRSFAMPENGMTCMEGGNWTKTVKCIEDKAGCSLPSDHTFLYKTLDGVQISPGSFIRNGTKVDVYCQDIEFGDYSDYTDANEADDSVSHVECLNGQLGMISLKCKTDVPETCTTLANGLVIRRFMNEYEVSCNEGYALNLMRPEMPYCECRNDNLVCRYGGQTPECKPVPCRIPQTFDNRLKIHVPMEEGDVSLSSGVRVDNGEIVIFSCNNTDVQYFEPNNRRFKCENGRWLETDTDQKRNFRNNGEFPICRNTICEPPCKHGGKCIRDDTCECPHHTSGKRCEKDLPDGCFEYMPKFYPFAYNERRTDTFFIGSGINMTETKCKMECLLWKDKTCKSVYHSKFVNEHHVVQYYACWGFEEDKKDPHFYKEHKQLLARYFVRTCAPQKR